MTPTRRTSAVIFGAPRSGTTSLWRYLAKHPDIAPSKVKELDFFKSANPAGDYDASFAEDGQVTLEASPVYFREHGSIAPRLAEQLPYVRLVCILREPASRLVAYFRGERDWQGRVADDCDFARYAEIVAHDLDPAPICPANPQAAQYVKDGAKVGIYEDILTTYLAHFPRESILVLFMDELKANPRAVVERCCHHMGIDPARMPEIDFSVENKGVNVRNVRLFRFLRRLNNGLEPIFNRMPGMRKALKRLHGTLNGAPADLHAKAETRGRAILELWYSPHNRRFAELMGTTYPETRLPDWLRETKVGDR